jgi:hypothetical protein
MFHSCTVHRALPNLSDNLIRISADNRYQLENDPIDPSSLLPHYGL